MITTSSRIAGLALLSALAACAAPSAPLVSSAQAPAPSDAQSAPAKPASAESLTITFPTSGTMLSTEATSQLDGAARLYRDAQPEVMIVAGHADPAGSEYPNLLLSARRANMVKRALVERGVPATRLQIIALGAAETTPNISPSRSVVVTWR